ncbi:hypothetical protein A2318_00780 [Candidatus Uhrbacteria bacterium RIFOXYB2_FULL_45_11]|uniref:Uncharacterized protein n=1 Tax=Candidatus Uhrbacteria bacterium RIFOXYB2_FULL_45_11 TaxID=1802421 RepID=A0A1F7W195_9BACT|nr:MAG: hypothetical protein A2318_00780 [Candidatus Uhrbacteria bacterium RIFOXYB2_FULL_45_11]
MNKTSTWQNLKLFCAVVFPSLLGLIAALGVTELMHDYFPQQTFLTNCVGALIQTTGIGIGIYFGSTLEKQQDNVYQS